MRWADCIDEGDLSRCMKALLTKVKASLIKATSSCGGGSGYSGRSSGSGGGGDAGGGSGGGGGGGGGGDDGGVGGGDYGGDYGDDAVAVGMVVVVLMTWWVMVEMVEMV